MTLYTRAVVAVCTRVVVAVYTRIPSKKLLRRERWLLVQQFAVVISENSTCKLKNQFANRDRNICIVFSTSSCCSIARHRFNWLLHATLKELSPLEPFTMSWHCNTVFIRANNCRYKLQLRRHSDVIH